MKKSTKPVVYTANIGHKDRLFNPFLEAKTSNIEYVYFTDSKKIASSSWDVQRVTDRRGFADSRMLAKWYKLHPHILFPGRTTVWIDANHCVTKDITPLLKQVDHLGVFKHSARNCIYEEVCTCVDRKVPNFDRVKKQGQTYSSKKYPQNNGLYLGNVLLRHDTKEVKAFNKLWWYHILKYSDRDQISLPFVLWRLKTPVKAFNYNQRRNWFMKCSRHRFHGTKQYENL